MRRGSEGKTLGCLSISIYIFFGVCWVINIYKLATCDFDRPYKEEVIHAVGLLIPPTSVVTVWF